MNKPSDKIYLNTEDSPELAEAISRLEPGDSIQFKGSASLDETADSVAVLSIVDFNVIKGSATKGKAKPEEDEDEGAEAGADDESAEGEEEAPALKLAKRKSRELGA